MTKWSFTAVALALVAMLTASNAKAIDPWAFDSEILFLRLHTAHGASQDNIFGFDPAQRYSLSYLGSRNIGTRLTYFEYDHGASFTAPGGVRRIALEMKNTDLEVFKRINLTNLTAVELSAGLRYSDNAVSSPVTAPLLTGANDFTGLGGLLAFRGTAKVGTGGEFYARGKMAILGGNGKHNGIQINTPNQRFDEGRTHTEIAFGYQHTFNYSNVLITPHFGGEWINLSDYQVDPNDHHPDSDAMLAGFTFGINLNF